MRTWSAVLAGVVVWLAPGGAGAIVLEACPPAPVPVVPVGGWVPLPQGGNVHFSSDFTVASNGKPVAGEEVLVEGHRYWRPDETLPSGTELIFTSPDCEATGQSFQVRVEGRGLPPQIDFTPSLTIVLDEYEPTETVACRQDPEVLVEAGDCDCVDCGCPEPAEVPIALAEVWRGNVQWLDVTGAGARGQVLVRETEWFGEPSDSEWVSFDLWWPSTLNVQVGEEPLCTTFELLVVPTDQRSELRHCIDPPDLSLGSQPVVPRFGRVYLPYCTLPPEGFEAEWCAAFQQQCEGTVAYPEAQAALCRHHYELCGSSAPSQPVGAGGDPFASGGGPASGGTTSGSTPPPPGDDRSHVGKDGGFRFGCSAARRPPPVGLGGVGGGLLLLGCVGLLRRRWAPVKTWALRTSGAVGLRNSR